MTLPSMPFRLSFLAMSSVIFLGIMMWALEPDKALIWVLAIGTMPLMWLFIEFRMRARPGHPGNHEKRDQIRYSVLGGSLLIGLPLAFQYADASGLLTGSNTLDERAFGIVMGLILVAFGNVIPKKLPELGDGTAQIQARKQARLRFAGWVFVLAGLGHSLIWLILPLEWANTAAMIDVGAGLLIIAVASLITSRKR